MSEGWSVLHSRFGGLILGAAGPYLPNDKSILNIQVCLLTDLAIVWDMSVPLEV